MKKAVTLIALTVLATGLGVWQTADVLAQDNAVEPLVTGYELMEIFYEPYMDQLKAAVAVEPDKRRGWQDIYKNSLALGELAALNLSRNDEDYMATPEWKDLNLATRTLNVEIAEAAKNKDFATVTAKYQALVQSCNACHTKFAAEDAPTIEP